jgi:inner membrane protein
MTPMGCRTLYPLNYTFHKKEGYFAIAIWVLLVFYVIKLA